MSDTKPVMTFEEAVCAFNDWMTDNSGESPDPAKLAADWQTALDKFRADLAAGRTPSYGTDCAKWLFHYAGLPYPEENDGEED
jgi:hypothetical protein